MGLETPTWIDDLVVTNPVSTDQKTQGDDHIRNLKTALKNTFPNATKAFYFPNAAAKTGNYSVVAADQNSWFTGDSSGGAFTFTLPSLAAGDDGWYAVVQKIDSSANAVIVAPPSGTINGAANISITRQYGAVILWWTGSAFFAFEAYIFAQTRTDKLSALTDPALADVVPIYDDSGAANLKITLPNLLKIVSLLTALTAPAIDDSLLVYDLSATEAKRITPDNLFKAVDLFTALTAPVVGDFYPIFDTSATAIRKIDHKYVNPFATQYLHVRDEKAAGTEGGAATSGAWRTRTLNTVVTNEITGASLASNQITLPAGTYYIIASAPSFSANMHKAKLRNISDGSDTIIGTSERSDSDGGENDQTRSLVMGRFTIAAEKIFELQHRTNGNNGTNGFGLASDLAVVEVYAEVEIWKLA